MGNSLRVDPVDVHMSSGHMDVHHADLTAAHTAADGEIEGAQAGWVGASAAALQSKMTEWQATTTKLCGDIAAHRGPGRRCLVMWELPHTSQDALASPDATRSWVRKARYRIAPEWL